MTLVVDASVATKWLLPESDSDEAWRLLADDLVAPPLFRLECGNAIIRRLRIRQLSADEAEKLLAEVLVLPVTVSPVADEEVLKVALALRHPVYDCAYLVLARQLDLRLITADRRLKDQAESGGFKGRVTMLADYA